MAETWFEQAMAVGLARLAALALPGTPIDERTAAACRAVWVDALWPGRLWDRAQDEKRIEEAFRQLSLRCKRWPSPSEFMEALPHRPVRAALPEPRPDAAQRARIAAHLAEIKARLVTH